MMLQITRTTEETPLDRLRSLLDKADARIGSLETASPDQALELLRMLDDIESIHADLAAMGVDMRAEDTRLETVRLTLQRKAGLVLRLLRPHGGIAELREKYRASEQRWWWYLDHYEAEQRKRAVRGLMVGVGVIIAIIAFIAILFQTVLRPNPEAVARLNYTQQAQTAVQRGDLNEALHILDQAVTEFPNDGEILIWRGVVLSLLGRQADAQKSFAAARRAYPDEASYLVERSNIRLQAGDADGALADAQAAIVADPTSAQAYLMLGGAQEVKGQYQAALQSYSTAANLAAASNNTQLEAIAKIRMATLMQVAPLALPTPQATP